MSSTDLNNEDYFSDHPRRVPSFDALFRAQAQCTPEQFFRNLEQQSGDNHCSQDEYQSGSLRTWRVLENSERYPGWIEKGISGCR